MLNKTFESMGTVVSVSYYEGISQEEASNLTKEVFLIFDRFDREFSTYREDSFISRINAKLNEPLDISDEAIQIFELAEQYRLLTDGYFDIITPEGMTDPSGIVKAFAIKEAGLHLDSCGVTDWCINAGGDILISNTAGLHAGIVNPFSRKELISDVVLNAPLLSLATSGFSERGNHIWNPKESTSDVIQASVISDDIVFSDIMATAIIACGTSSLQWIEAKANAEALLIKKDGSFLVTGGYLALVP